MSKDDLTNTHERLEIEQERILLKKINESLKEKSKIKENEKKELLEKIKKFKHDTKELQMTKKFLENKLIVEEKKMEKTKKYVFILLGMVIVIAIGFTSNSLLFVDLIEQKYKIIDLGNVKSHYIIQNLKGDMIDTWISWQIPYEKTIYVNIVQNKHLTDEIYDVIEEVIVSEKTLKIDDSRMNKGPKGNTSTYFLGWVGALKEASKSTTKNTIPVTFEIISDPNTSKGDIIIKLTDLSHGDGYAGYTKTIADATHNQILKSEITIYDIDKMHNNNIKVIMRHELGHAFGLAHSTAPEDLMAPKITTNYPYISPCNIDAIVFLYDDGKRSKIICEK